MSDNTVLEQAQKICRNLLDIDPPETIEKIKDAIQKVASIIPLSNADRDILFARLIDVTGVTQDAARILDIDDKIEPWILNKWSENPGNRKFWKRYKDYLADEKKIAPKVISRLDDLTNNIMDRLVDPTGYDQFDKRGLVVGHVQSGKTSNYVGLIAKAADAGYKLIIVLAGIHSTLRSQTQLRIDEGFLGFDTVTSRSSGTHGTRIGVGRIDPDCPAQSLTSSALNGDFKKSKIDNGLYLNTMPTVVVIKKNNSVLKNLIQWLDAKAGKDLGEDRVINDLSLLLIDDEADNASINVSKSSVSTINGSIRALLELFRKSAYVGYTATPYANVFIPPPKKETEKKGIKIAVGNKDYPVGEDIFPRDFIVNIPAPSNYIGPEKFFGVKSEDKIYEEAVDEEDESRNAVPPLNLYEPVDDYQPADYSDSEVVKERIRGINNHFIPDAHKKGDRLPESLPPSLEEAVKFFILACAARRVRGQINVHNSMLVHVTRFVDWQNHIAVLVTDTLDRYKRRIELNSPGFLAELKDIWEKKFEKKTKEISALHHGIIPVYWKELELQLLPAVIKIQVRAVHGSSLLGGLEPENIEALDYYENQKKGLSVIAVGGNKLSRGLTLEGLTISYYLRASKMYDTLMQMGRWFGYRPGYLDLCRLFTSIELVGYYKHIVVATEEMRAEFDRMALLKEKPREYGLKVRADTGVLTITAANRFLYKKIMYFGFSGKLVETWQFVKNRQEVFDKNHTATQAFIKSLGPPSDPANKSKHLKMQRYVWHGKNNYKDVIHYLGEYLSAQPSFLSGMLKEYIQKQAGNKKLTNWTIALIHNSRAQEENQVAYYGNHKVGLSDRKDDAKDGSQNYELAKAHIIGNFHEYIDLSNPQLEQAFKDTSKDRIEDGKNPETEHPSPLRIRKNRSDTNGLLLIYPLNPKPIENRDPYSAVPIIGLAISFPYINGEEEVPYAVNKVFSDNLNYPEELDIDDLEEEDGDEKKDTPSRKDPLSEETFISIIEDSYQAKLAETEFFSGMVPSYLKLDEDKNLVMQSRTNLVVSANESIPEEISSSPIYTQKDIQQYYLEDVPSQIVLTPENGSVVSGEYVVGLKQSKYVTFSYHNQPAAFTDNCWIIKGGRFDARYLAALFNSTLFGAWVRVNGEQKKETYFIKNDVLYKFPLVLPAEESLWLYRQLYELLAIAGKKEQTTGAGAMKSYYASILDALIFCNYFPYSMQKESQTLHGVLKQLIPREMPASTAPKVALAEELYKVIYSRKHPVRETLYYLGNQPKVNRIKSVFTGK